MRGKAAGVGSGKGSRAQEGTQHVAQALRLCEQGGLPLRFRQLLLSDGLIDRPESEPTESWPELQGSSADLVDHDISADDWQLTVVRHELATVCRTPPISA